MKRTGRGIRHDRFFYSSFEAQPKEKNTYRLVRF